MHQENNCEETKLFDLLYQATKRIIPGMFFLLTYHLTYAIRPNHNVIIGRFDMYREIVPKKLFKEMMKVII